MYNKNAWTKYKNTKPVMDFGDEYKNYLDNSKTERLATKESVKLLEECGFKNINKCKSLKKGDKVYAVNRNKNVVAFIIGNKPIIEGLRILGAHIDSPRLDLKPNPLYEELGFVMLDTHYYGGIKKYQWLTTPLALVGVVCKKDGTKIDVNIGLNPDDPIFGISDLLIHLSNGQLDQPIRTFVSGEQLDITFASMPSLTAKESLVKANVIKILKEKYNTEEEDFISAEIEVVPAAKSRDYGIDRSMISGYGHDDRCCAFASLKAILDVAPKDVKYTSCLILTDKEEVGSVGATGAHSFFLENTLLELFELLNEKHPILAARKCLANSKMISSDVTAAMDPLYKNANSPHRNMARFAHGIAFSKYTGSRGKSGANDANPEYIAYLRNVLDDNNVYHQHCELGAVDVGGGGTIAYILAKYNMDVIDAGIPLLNMHAPMEILSKADLYESYLCYKAFLESK